MERSKERRRGCFANDALAVNASGHSRVTLGMRAHHAMLTFSSSLLQYRSSLVVEASEEEPGQQCPGAEEEDAVEYGAHILPIDWIIGGLWFEFRSSPEESYSVS